MTPILVEIPYSPWSWRARRALELEGVRFERVTFVPTVTEPWLRWRTRRWTGPVTVPVLLTEGEPLLDSTEIAAWASRQGQAGLFPEADEADIRAVVALADAALAAGRLRATTRVIADPAALREQVPGFLAWLGPLGPPIAKHVAGGIIKKYAHLVEAGPDQALADAIAALAAHLAGRAYAVGERLTYADLAAASALSFVEPLAEAELGPATRVAFSAPELGERHADLLAWRGRILAELEG